MNRRWDKSKPPRGPFALNRDCLQAQGVIIWYPFGTAGGLWAPDRAGTTHLIQGTKPTYGLDKWGAPAAKFAVASTQYLESVTDPNGWLPPVSMSGWVNHTSFAHDSWILGMRQNAGQGYNGLFSIASNTSLYAASNGFYASIKSGLTTGAWQHCGGVFATSASRTAYLNGVAAAAQTTSSTGYIPTLTVIGNWYGGSGYHIDAQIADVLFWATAIGQSVFDRLNDPGLRFEHWYPLRSKRWISVPGIKFDSGSNSGYQTGSNYTLSRLVAQTSPYLSVDVELITATGASVTSVTDDDGGGNVAMTLIGARSTFNAGARVEMWGLANPTAGTKNIRVILSAAVDSIATAQVHGGVDQSPAPSVDAFNSAQATNAGSATDASVSITSTADKSVIVAAVATTDTSITANQTTRNNVSGANGSGADEDSVPITPVGATTMSYTGMGTTAGWAIAGYALRPVGASVVGSFAATDRRDTMSATGTVAPTVSNPIILFAVSEPTPDNTSHAEGTITFTPPPNMLAGDLVVIFANRFESAGNRTDLWSTGLTSDGQQWIRPNATNPTADPRHSGAVTVALNCRWCRYTGAWAANPSIAVSSSAVMLVFRAIDPEKWWRFDIWPVVTSAVAPSSPFTCTLPGITTTINHGLAVAALATNDANTFSTLTGSGWSQNGLSPQYRNTHATDGQKSMAIMYKPMETAGATGNVSLNQATSGGDAYGGYMMSFAMVTLPSGGSGGALAHVGHTSGQIHTIAYSPTAGNCVVVRTLFETSYGAPPNTNSPFQMKRVTDNTGLNSYFPVTCVGSNNFTDQFESFYCPNISAGVTTIFFELQAGTPGFQEIIVDEFSGNATLDQFRVFLQLAGGGTTITPGSITPSRDGAYIVVLGATASITPVTAPGSWGTVQIANEGYGEDVRYLIDRTQTTAAAITPSVVQGTDSFAAYTALVFVPNISSIVWTGSGGARFGGTAGWAGTHLSYIVWTGAGGARFGGTAGWVPTSASPNTSSTWTPSGGMGLSGSAAWVRRKYAETAGGAVFGGDATWAFSGAALILPINPRYVVIGPQGTRRKKLPRKDPEGEIIITFDFTAELISGETLLTPVVTAIVLAGTDPTPAAILDGAPQQFGSKVTQRVSGGLAGTNYRPQCVVPTSKGQILVLSATLPVREA